ncbi:hypothetical protein Neosp_015158 [[Neocosmospora] mangrovei]
MEFNFNVDDIWGEGEEHGVSPTRAAQEHRPEPTHDTKSDHAHQPQDHGPPPAPPTESKPEPPPHQDEDFSKGQAAARAQGTALTGITDGAHRGWRLFCFVMLSSPVQYLLGFFVILALLWGVLKALLFTFPTLIANNAILGFVDRISTYQWLTRSDPYDGLPSLSFPPAILTDESEILPHVLEETWVVLSETFPHESYHLRADFERSRARINTLESLTQQGIMEQIEARATRDYQQILALLDDLPEATNQDESTTEYSWYNLRSAAWYRMQEALRFQTRLKAIVETAIKDINEEGLTISHALEAAEEYGSGSQRAGICQAEPVLRKLPASTWKGSDLTAACVMACKAEDQASARWKRVAVTVTNFEHFLKKIVKDIEALSRDTEHVDATLRQIKHISIRLKRRYEEFASWRDAEQW